jgi:hypothetical protein
MHREHVLSTTPATARTPRELAQLPQPKAFLYNLVLLFLEAVGAWRYPIRASGDYEEMTRRDVIYWLHKAKHHVVHPERGSHLEEYFEGQQSFGRLLPEDFEPQSTLSISAAGDLMNHEYLPNSPHLYHHVARELFGSDLSMANLECVVLDEPSEVPRFDGTRAPRLRLDTDTFDLLTSHEGRRYAFLSAACNHSLDFGEEGVRSTADRLHTRGIAFHGINATREEADRSRIMERKGIKVAILAHTFGLNGWEPPADRPWIVNRTRLNQPAERLDLTAVHRQIAHGRNSGADFVIAHLHWGMEFEYFPRTTQMEVAHTLAESGVDAIFGHHPHVIQPFENYRTRRDPSRVVPVFYSLGNLTNPYWDPRLSRSSIARLDLAKGRTADGSVRTYVRRAGAIPVRQTVDWANRRINVELEQTAHTI